jgi:hypothetical protein
MREQARSLPLMRYAASEVDDILVTQGKARRALLVYSRCDLPAHGADHPSADGFRSGRLLRAGESPDSFRGEHGVEGAGHGGLPFAAARATLAAHSEPGSVRTMCSLAASDSALEVARAMTDPAISPPSGIAVRRSPGQPPDAIRSALCIYCRTEMFVYWPPAIRLSMADCPGCQRREPAGRDIAPLDG